MIKISVTYKGNSADFLRSLSSDPKVYLRPVAIEMIGEVAERIHERGEDSNGQSIGTYSTGYMKVRTGNFKTGEGKFTRGAKKGQPRPRYNRDNSTEVIASLTRQLENDYAVIGTENGWAIGVNSELSAQKIKWVENTYKKKIWKLTPEELILAREKATREINKGIRGDNT